MNMIKFNVAKTNKIVLYFLGVVGGLIAVSLIISCWLGFAASFRMVFGSFYVLVLPGLVLTYAFFPSGAEKSIDLIERITLSFALSIACVPLLVFYLNLIGVKINFFNVFWEILFIILAGLGVSWWRRKKKNS